MKPTRTKLLERDALMEYAARSLSARAQSVSELRTRLRKKAAHPEDVDDVLAYLKETGYADDSRFAGMFADWRRENQGFGKARVLRDLMSRRVPQQVAQAAVETAFKDSDETKLVEDFLARKYRGKNLPLLLKEPKNLASAYRKLRTAGFSSNASIKVLKRYAASAEEIEDSPEDVAGEEGTES